MNPTIQEIRAGIVAAAARRARAEAEAQAAKDELIYWLELADEQRRYLPIREAVKLAGISRQSYYDWLGLSEHWGQG